MDIKKFLKIIKNELTSIKTESLLETQKYKEELNQKENKNVRKTSIMESESYRKK